MRWMLLGMIAIFSWPAFGEDAPDAGFKLVDQAGEHLDVLLDGKVAARYVYIYDTSTPERLEATYKPFLHVFDADGKSPITKGPGGEYTHHRGIFIGWNNISVAGKTFDRWHMKDGAIVHRKFEDQNVTSDVATFTSITDWNDDAGKPFLTERRTFVIRRAPAPARFQIEVTSELTASANDVTLDGDPEHAGVHFRPADELDRAKTSYLYPSAAPEPHKDNDYPWVAQSFFLGDKQHCIAILNHPDNPKQTRWSAYRNYGRFGAFPVAAIEKGKTLSLKYGFLIADGEMLPAEMIQKSWDNFTGAAAPTTTPQATRLPAE